MYICWWYPISKAAHLLMESTFVINSSSMYVIRGLETSPQGGFKAVCEVAEDGITQ